MVHFMNAELHRKIELNLKKHMQGLCGLEQFNTALDYSVLPAGKLFRPKLAIASFLDELTNLSEEEISLESNQNIALISSALEIHHAYTLVHDDLPCMDDDDYRRGRESTHKKFGQWHAVLAGDALLHHSHQLIGKCKGLNHYTLRSIFNWALGAKGLILGQVFDLSGLINSDFPSLLRTHELKTGRLIQTSLLAGKWAAKTVQDKALTFGELKEQMRLGANIGIVFQLLDDLSEMTEELSAHEEEVNPFLRFPEQSINSLNIGLKEIKSYQGINVSMVLTEYFKKMKALMAKDLKFTKGLIETQLTSPEFIVPIKNLVDSL
jgi:geranylgeranyl pyrophosphate synthase